MLQHLPSLRHIVFSSRKPTLEYLGSTFSATDTDPYTFSTQFLGRPHNTRRIIVGVHCEDALTNFSLTSVTVSGVTATAVVGSANTPAIKALIQIVALPQGWYGDVVADWSEAITSCGISLWAAYNLNSATAIATGTATADNTAINLAVQAGSLIVACSTNAAAGDTCTWAAPLTEQYDTNATDIQQTGASYVSPIAQTVACTADFVTGTAVQGAAAAFR